MLSGAEGWLLLTALRSFKQRNLERTKSLQKESMISAILYFLALGAFIGHSYIQIVLLKVFFFLINILELDLQMASITEKRKIKKHISHSFIFILHLQFHKKKWLYVITIFLKVCLKKHASFIDEVPDIKKLRLFSQSTKKRMQWLQTSFFFCK